MHWRPLRGPSTLYLLIALCLLWLILRQVAFVEIWQVFRQLRGIQLVHLGVLNGLVLATMVARWRLLLLAQGHALPYRVLLHYRLAAFGITYFTPGPQFGGEPLQVYLVHKQYGVPLQESVAAVTVDKLLEMLVNFGFLACGVTVLLSQDRLSESWAYGALLVAILLLAMPLCLLLAFRYGYRPLQSLSTYLNRQDERNKLTSRWSTASWLQRGLAFGIDSEAQAIDLCQRHPVHLMGALVITLIGWVVMIVEFGYAIHSVGHSSDTILSTIEILGVFIAARVAYLLPMPAGIGTFEGALALAFYWLHSDPATGLALSLLIRGRDTLLGGIGLWLGSIALGRYRVHPILEK